MVITGHKESRGRKTRTTLNGDGNGFSDGLSSIGCDIEWRSTQRLENTVGRRSLVPSCDPGASKIRLISKLVIAKAGINVRKPRNCGVN